MGCRSKNAFQTTRAWLDDECAGGRLADPRHEPVYHHAELVMDMLFEFEVARPNLFTAPSLTDSWGHSLVRPGGEHVRARVRVPLFASTDSHHP